MEFPIQVINKSIIVLSSENEPNRCKVVTYVNGTLDSIYAPMARVEAIEHAKRLADNDSVKERRLNAVVTKQQENP